jgi:hypothetical protein
MSSPVLHMTTTPQDPGIVEMIAQEPRRLTM